MISRNSQPSPSSGDMGWVSGYEKRVKVAIGQDWCASTFVSGKHCRHDGLMRRINQIQPSLYSSGLTRVLTSD